MRQNLTMQAFDAGRFKGLIEEGFTVIDTRNPEEFCDGFIEESISIPFDENFVDNYDELTQPGQRIVLITEPDNTTNVFRALKAAAIDSAEGYLEGGFAAWQDAGNDVDMLIPIDESEFAIDYNFDEFYLVDVRSKEDFAKEHPEDAENIELNDLEQILIELDNKESYYVYGNTVTEAVTAGSIFKRTGFNRVRVVAASYDAIKQAGIPLFVQKKKDKGKEDKASSEFSDN